MDSIAGTAAFDSYDTSRAATQPGYRNRVLTVPAAFAEARLEVRPAGVRNVFNNAGSGWDLRWSTAELHAAMVANLSQYRDVPQRKVQGYSDLSWMNYPDNYQGPKGDNGQNAVWGGFPFAFSDSELRHGFRPPDIIDSVQQLTAAVDASLGDEGLDNITLNAAMRRLALVHVKDGNTQAANQVLDTLVTTFEHKNVPAPAQRS
ncbi:hypothetical protein GCM10010232_56220 [Streptomyces amakusaensis]|uniref:Uncharacterized protein n=1 Tax=Streptomyces amakusaensis TaxID=67271 RepID=A0ABW0AQ92_9ACTN